MTQGRGPWILVLDDEPLVARATCRILLGCGAEPVVATDRAAAFELLATHTRPPAALVLDLSLPGPEDGLDVLGALRAAGCMAPCAIWSSHHEAVLTARVRGRRHGEAVRLFTKLRDADALRRWARERAAAAGTADSDS